MFDNIGWGTYAFFAAMNLVIMLPCVILFFPETRRYSLEDVSHTFKLPMRRPVLIDSSTSSLRSRTTKEGTQSPSLDLVIFPKLERSRLNALWVGNRLRRVVRVSGREGCPVPRVLPRRPRLPSRKMLVGRRRYHCESLSHVRMTDRLVNVQDTVLT